MCEPSGERVLYKYRNRSLTHSDLEEIRSVTAEHYGRGRSYISRVLCERWDWRQENGRYKEYACRDLLLRLEERGYLELPPRIRPKNNLKRKQFEDLPLFPPSRLDGRLGELGPFRLRPVDGRGETELWDSLVESHHYLGYRTLVGEKLKYLAWLGDQEVACVGWASASYKCAVRDDYLGWSTEQRKANLSYVANNVRFLILPWVQVPHLASKVLAANLRRLSSDWATVYGHRLYLAETFVDLSRFRGTCYRAANWKCLGETVGLSKRGNRYHRHDKPKAVFVYPLDRRLKQKLCRGP